jgi:hypothetical protein
MASLTEYKTAFYAMRSGQALNYYQASLFCRERFFDALLRTDHITMAYEKHTANVLKEYNTLEDYILFTVFGFSRQPNSIGKMVAVIPIDVGSEIRLVENEFPYNFSDDVRQFILWSLKPPAVKDAEEFIQKELTSRGYKEYCCAINVKKQTIPALWHIHIIAKVCTIS